MNIVKRRILLMLSSAFLFGCSKQENHPVLTPDRPSVHTVNYPLAYFSERITDGRVEVVFPAMEGDPAFWKPTPEQIGAFQSADLIILNGADYARWVQRVSLPQARLVDTASGFVDRLIAVDGEITHTHGPDGAHVHGDLAFTVWVDPSLAMLQATAIEQACAGRWPDDATAFSTNLRGLVDDLGALDAGFEQSFARFGRQPVLGSHPVYQYLARRYALNMKSVHWEPEVEPGEASLRELDAVLDGHRATLMLWESEPLESTRQLLAERGIRCIVFDPCSNRPIAGDYLSTMQANLSNLTSAPANQ